MSFTRTMRKEGTRLIENDKKKVRRQLKEWEKILQIMYASRDSYLKYMNFYNLIIRHNPV